MASDPEFEFGATIRNFGEGVCVFDRFRLIRLLGRGGMGMVWLARDEKLDLEVALKFLPEMVGADEAAVDDLARETRRARELAHPNIVRVYDFHQDANLAGISMEYVDGATLTRLRLNRPRQVFEPEELRDWLEQLAAALDYAHGEKLVHRDLKPANLMVNSRGRLKVTDFGISALVSESVTRVSRVASSSGSPPYMSPQQMMGERARVSDDVYSLGATLYELLTGKPPFHSGNIFQQVQSRMPPSVAERRKELEVSNGGIPPAWEQTIAACLAKDPAQRPASAAEVIRQIGAPPLSSDTDEPGHPEPGRQVAPPPDVEKGPEQRRRRSLQPALWAAQAIVVFATAGLVWYVTQTSREPVAGETLGGAASQTPSAPIEQPPSAATATTTSEFVVTVDPPDAEARLWLGPHSDVEVKDGRAAVPDLTDGEHELTVWAQEFQPFTTRVEVKDGAGTIRVPLVPVRGALAVKARPGTIVTAVDARGGETRLGTVPSSGTLTNDNVLTIGRYALRLEHPDCAPVTVPDVDLTVGRAASLAPAQTPLPGELRVFSVPDGAEVRLSGSVAGRTPATLREVPSERPLPLEVFLRGYRRATQEVTLAPKEVRTINVGTLVAESGGVELRVGNAVSLDQTRVTVDGRAVAPHRGGEGWRVEGLEVGERSVEIAHADYEPWKQTVTVRDQGVTPIEVSLKPKPAVFTLVVRGPSEYELLVDDAPVVVRDGRASLPAGREVTLAVRARGFKEASRTLTPRPNQTESWNVTLEKLAGPETGQPWMVPELGLAMVWIKPGEFTMGSPSTEEGRAGDEGPQTQVRLSRGYWLGKHEVTQAEWQALMGSNPSRFKNAGAQAPVESVSWEDAMEFCRKLTVRERAAGRLSSDLEYTLPTEAQWEYACRAGTDTAYSFGPDGRQLYRFGNFADRNVSFDWRDASQDDGVGETTAPVGKYQANKWGLHDMHGNVWEWCFDWYADTLPGGSVVDPTGPPSDTNRVYRGGSWDLFARFCRSADRYWNDPRYRSGNRGFRVALSSVR